MNHFDPPLYRRLIPWVMAALYAIVTLFAAYYVFELRDSQRTHVVEQIDNQLQDQVAVWEDELLDKLTEWMNLTVGTPDRAARRQGAMRLQELWFNALYVWTQHQDPRARRIGLPPEPTFLFPPPPITETESLSGRVCLGIARRTLGDVDTRARAYLQGCRDEGLAVRLYAASEAANLYKDVGRIHDALRTIESVHPAENLTLAEAARRGIPPLRLQTNRLQRANYYLALGHTDQALDLLYKLGEETMTLDAPEARDLIQNVRHWIIRILRHYQRTEDAKRLELMLSKVERRVAAFDEIRARILQRTGTATATEAPRFIYDQYSENPFLLYYGWSPGGDYGVALQLEQGVLVQEFLAMKGLSRLRRHLTITDGSGNVVAGVRRGGEIAVQVPFPRTLTHLRVGVREDAVAQRLERTRSAWVTPLVIIALCGLLGVLALAVQVRASRQQTLIMKRQREFTTRVTHELKTPLAGIRVMAENLELGAYKTEAQLQDMARRIVDEADRLTVRVEEVLSVARDRALPDPEPFDPEEAVLEAIDQWGPRMEQVGVRLHADLHPTDEVQGDLTAIRDAVSCLLDNALKYRREDRPDAQVWLDLHQSGRWVILTVADNGIGVPADMREAIFERFVRVEGPNRGKAGGHGLGLSQVAAIARAHRGDVRCTEGVEGGARFTLRLPAHQG